MVAKKKKFEEKIFVLDTSVLLHDHSSVINFSEHDVIIPISVLEELDNFKKGNDNINFEARSFTRLLDELSEGETLDDWMKIKNKKKARLKVEMNETSKPDACEIFGANKADHRILNTAIKAQAEFPNKMVILVSKDINLRIKAKSVDLTAEDYLAGKVHEDSTQYRGKTQLDNVDEAVINKIYEEGSCLVEDVFKGEDKPVPNHYFILKNGKSSALTYYNKENERIERVEKRAAYGITARNAEQVFAMHALLNPDVKIVSLSGVAGTGKTLLALSSAIEQKRNFRQIYLARPIVPLSNKDIGYLPGDIKSKLNPYMEPLWDNLKMIQGQYKETEKDYKKITEMVEQEKLVISPLAYIRGRSLSNIYFIVDEAQNLTPHEIKTIVTRAGENTKIVFTGDIYQIDTPYLDTQSNGLSYLIDRMQGHPIYAHITLEKGERSELAEIANELL